MVTVSCARIESPDLSVIHQLARMQLCARRSGSELCFTEVSDELVALIEMVGLGKVLRVQVRRQPEQREEPFRVEEEGELPDLPV
jgi:anti-anti-sigma regulatory factor